MHHSHEFQSIHESLLLQMSNGMQARPSSPSSQHSQHSPGAGDCRTSNGHLTASNGGGTNALITTTADSGATTTTTSSVNGGVGVGESSRRCGRPSCGSVNPTTGGAEFCSSECVVGQCREVYTNWSGAAATNGQPQQQQQAQPAPPPPRSEYSPRLAK